MYRAIVAASAISLSWSGTVFAQSAATGSGASYPTKSIRWIVPYAPGGGTDILARMFAQKYVEAWGQQVIVDNRPGGGTNLGSEMAAKAPADGYTLFSPTVANAINATLFEKLNYDIVRDFAHVTNFAKIPNILVVNPSVAAKSVKELIALAKARPNLLRNGSPGVGSPQHLGGEIFKTMASVQMVHVPYKGAAPALTDLIGGHIEVYFGAIISTIGHVKNGRARVLGVTSLRRIEAFPDIPTMDEQGLKGFEVASWVGVSAPARTPRDIVLRLHREAVKALNTNEVRERLRSEGTEPGGDTPEQMTAYIKAEVEKWGKAVKASGAKPEG